VSGRDTIQTALDLKVIDAGATSEQAAAAADLIYL
jgi:hypothetical protein